MSSSEPRGDRLTADDFIAYGSDSVDGLTESSSGGLAEPLSSSTSQNLKRGGRPRLQEQKTAGMPQWYIKKIQDRTASRKQMADLQALLQGPDSEYVTLSMMPQRPYCLNAFCCAAGFGSSQSWEA